MTKWRNFIRGTGIDYWREKQITNINKNQEEITMLPIIKRNSYFPSIVDEFFGKDLPVYLRNETGVCNPSVNIVESNDEFRIELAAPGLEREDFRINFKNNVLTISSEKDSQEDDKNYRFMRREFNYTQFNRSFSLPMSADSEKINASYKNGVLTIQIPKREEAKVKPAREIAIA